MLVYIYDADIYCEQCGEAIRKRITRACLAPANPDDERSYDSDEFPKGPYPDGGGEDDCPRHCGAGPECLNAIELSDGRKIGVWLENPLTSSGEYRVLKAVLAREEIAMLWAEYYANSINIECVAELGQLITEHGAAFAAYANHVGVYYATEESFQDTYCGKWESKQAYAKDLFDNLCGHVPEHIASCIDYEAFSRNLFIDNYYSVDCPRGGVYVFSN